MATDPQLGALWLRRGPAPFGEASAGAGGHLVGYDDADQPGQEIVCWSGPAGAGPPAGFGSGQCEWFGGRVTSDRGGTETAGAYILVVGFAVPPEAVDRFDDWYESEHSPLLLQAEGWLRVRRLMVGSASGGDWTHVAVHDLASLAVLDSPERDAARNGPKRQQFVDLDWYQRSGRWMGHRFGLAQ